MKSSTVSLRRRQLMIAGLASAAAPTALFAAECSVTHDPFAPPTVAEVSANPSGDKLIVSGRVVGGDCKPLFGAVVEAWHDGSNERTSATTDADGRFMLTTAPVVEGRLRPLRIRVSHGQRRLVQQHYFTKAPGAPDETLSHLNRDDTGTWRTTLGLTLA